MKKINLALILLLVATFLASGQAMAYPVVDDSTVYLKVADQSPLSKFNGNYDVFKETDSSFAFSTFCLQLDTHFYPDTNYVATIDDKILGYSPTDRNASGSGNLTDETKYLFWNFTQGTLDGYDGSSTAATSLQNAIWQLQGYAIKVTTENNDFYKKVTELSSIDTAGMNVKVMNLWNSTAYNTSNPAQSQLIAGPAPVPEPATMVLLGSGLVGLALYRRRMKK